MASHWFHHQAAAGSSNNYPGSYGDKKPEVDLTLKLGLPDDTDNNNTKMFNPVPMAPVPDNYFPNINFNNSPYQVQGGSRYGTAGGHGGLYQYGMAGAGGSANTGFVNNFPMNTEGRINYGSLNQLYGNAQSSNHMGNYQYPQNLINPMSNGGVENQFNMINNDGGSMMGLQAASFNNPSGYNPGTVAFPPPIANEYTLIDTPSRRTCNIEIHDPFLDGSSAAAADRRGARRQRTGTYNEPTKRCSNYNCNTTDTPMWRRGPLGPKTLCNACGIKFRKEEEKRKAKEASRSSG